MSRSRASQPPRSKGKREQTAQATAPVRRPVLRLFDHAHRLPPAGGLQPAIVREIVAAQATLGNQHVQRLIAPTSLKTWTSGSKLSDAVVFDKKMDAYVAKWALAAPEHEAAAVSLDEKADEAARVLDLAIESNADNTSMKVNYLGVELEQQFLDLINTMHTQVRESESALKDREAELKKAKGELAAAKARQKSASEQKKDDADFDVTNAEEKVKLQELLIPAIEERIASLRARIRAGISNLKLHEETHLQVSAKAASMANRELKAVRKLRLSATERFELRQRIVDSAIRIENEVQTRMDGLLNPSVLGAESQTGALVAWTTDRERKPPERQDEEDYHSMLREKFAEARENDWKPAE